MSAWCTKTSKLGIIPNISYEPRKPITLGTMFKNGIEFISGMFTFQDIFQGSEKQQQKHYFGEQSFISDDKHNTISRI